MMTFSFTLTPHKGGSRERINEGPDMIFTHVEGFSGFLFFVMDTMCMQHPGASIQGREYIMDGVTRSPNPVFPRILMGAGGLESQR